MENINCLTIFLLLTGIPVCYFTYLILFNCWHTCSTRGVSYFGKPINERRKFKEKINHNGILSKLFFDFLGPKIAKPNLHEFSYQKVHAPLICCSVKTFKKAKSYDPVRNDLFIATHMKCGTTWMQQIAYEILCHGNGDLSDNGHNHLYAMSPWIESFNSIGMDNAPLIGKNKMRIIKTHLPTTLCPYNDKAKYIYTIRHPISCFKSFVDFSKAVAGPLSPPVNQLADWFCSDQYWWGSWPDHVEGYWHWSQTKPNVLFFHFEELKKNLRSVIVRVAEFLNCELTDSEISKILTKCSFSYMKEHEEWFEMTPPTLFSAQNTFFKSGSAKRHQSVDISHQKKISDFCTNKLKNSSYPLSHFYSDIVSQNKKMG